MANVSLVSRDSNFRFKFSSKRLSSPCNLDFVNLIFSFNLRSLADSFASSTKELIKFSSSLKRSKSSFDISWLIGISDFDNKSSNDSSKCISAPLTNPAISVSSAFSSTSLNFLKTVENNLSLKFLTQVGKSSSFIPSGTN